MVSEKAGVTFVTCLGLSEGNTRAFDEATWGLDTTGREVFFFSRESYHVSMVDVILAYPTEFVQLLIRNARSFVASLLSRRLFPYYLLPLLGLAFFKGAWNKARAKGELLPTLAIWLGLGVYELGVWFKETGANLLESRFPRLQRLLYAVPVILMILFFLLLQPRIIRQYTSIDSFRPEHKTVGLWLGENISHESVVMSRYPALAFYADTRWEPTPNAEYAQLLAYAQANNVNYFVLDEVETRSLRPQLAFLLDENNVPAELELVHVDHSAKGKLVIFRLK
jgi:hypothetical protein